MKSTLSSDEERTLSGPVVGPIRSPSSPLERHETVSSQDQAVVHPSTSFNWPNRTNEPHLILPTLSTNFIRSLSSLNSAAHFQSTPQTRPLGGRASTGALDAPIWDSAELVINEESNETTPERLAARKSLNMLFPSFTNHNNLIDKPEKPTLTTACALGNNVKHKNPAKTKQTPINKWASHKPFTKHEYEPANSKVPNYTLTPGKKGKKAHNTTTTTITTSSFGPNLKSLPITSTSPLPPDPEDGSKPLCTYATLISLAILRSPEKKLTLSEIYKWISDNYTFFRKTTDNWRNSIRHNLTVNKAFIKQARPSESASADKNGPISGSGVNGKGSLWSVDEQYLGESSKAFEPVVEKSAVVPRKLGVSKKLTVPKPQKKTTAKKKSKDRPPILLKLKKNIGLNEDTIPVSDHQTDSKLDSKRRKLKDRKPSSSPRNEKSILDHSTDAISLDRTEPTIPHYSLSGSPAPWSGFTAWANLSVSEDSLHNNTLLHDTEMVPPLTPRRTLLLPPAHLELSSGSSSSSQYMMTTSETLRYLSPRSALDNHRLRRGELYQSPQTNLDSSFDACGKGSPVKKRRVIRETRNYNSNNNNILVSKSPLKPRGMGIPFGINHNHHPPPPSSSSSLVLDDMGEDYIADIQDIFGLDIDQIVTQSEEEEKGKGMPMLPQTPKTTRKTSTDFVTPQSHRGLLSPFAKQFRMQPLNSDLIRFDSPIKTQDLRHYSADGGSGKGSG